MQSWRTFSIRTIKDELYNILLNKEKIQFITDFRQELYNEAIKNGLVHFYENEE